jgi:hypothetical protein
MDLLAYKLAGLAPGRRGEERMVEEYRELFVETYPGGAEIYINGVRKGSSPILIEKVPKGWVYVEARKGNMYAYGEVDMQVEGPVEIRLGLEKGLGSIFIQSSESDVQVYIDGLHRGSLGSGLFEDVAVGEHELELKGEGLWWEGSATVKPGQRTRVEVYPFEVGSIDYRIPKGARAVIYGRNFRRTVLGAGVVENVPAGSYEVEIAGDIYVPRSLKLHIEKGKSAELAPHLEYMAWYEEGRGVVESESDMASLQSRKTELEIDYQRSLKRRKNCTTAAKVTFYSGVAAFAATGLALLMANRAYDKYKSTAYSDKALDYRNKTETWRMVSIVTGAAGGALGLSCVVAFGLRGNPEKIKNQIDAIDMKMENLGGGDE